MSTVRLLQEYIPSRTDADREEEEARCEARLPLPAWPFAGTSALPSALFAAATPVNL